MRKIICCILIACLFPALCTAEVDLSALSFDELNALSAQITAEVMSRPEWEGTRIPAGQWIIGQHIPAGFYSIRPETVSGSLKIFKDADDKYPAMKFVTEDSFLYRYELKEGNIIEVGSPLIFAPEMGF